MSRAGINPREMNKLLKTMKRLDVRLQKKVFTQATNATTRKVVLPAVKAKINPRSFDVPELTYRKRGLKKAMKSHNSPAGALRKNMQVKAIKRTRTAVGRLVVTPTREALEIPKDYPGYYPAFVEYGYTWGGKKTNRKPYLRGTFKEQRAQIQSFFIQESRRRIKTLRSM